MPPNDPHSTSRLNSVEIWALGYAVGPLVIFLLVMTFLFSPEFYRTWILAVGKRETQFVEIFTFACAFSAGVLLLIWIWRARRHAGQGYWRGIAGVSIIAAATVFFAGEEISWGQTYLGWATPEFYKDISPETNLHNTGVSIHHAASLFFVVFFFLVPLAWALRARLPWRGWPTLESMVAEGPVISTLLLALVWVETKGFYAFLHDDYATDDTYRYFFEQLNEQKEMIIALALLIYAILRFRHSFQRPVVQTG